MMRNKILFNWGRCPQTPAIFLLSPEWLAVGSMHLSGG
jgi:hypothetical protein